MPTKGRLILSSAAHPLKAPKVIFVTDPGTSTKIKFVLSLNAEVPIAVISVPFLLSGMTRRTLPDCLDIPVTVPEEFTVTAWQYAFIYKDIGSVITVAVDHSFVQAESV